MTNGRYGRDRRRWHASKEVEMRKLRIVIAAVALTSAGGAGVAYATHLFPPQLPPGSAPNGFFVSNNRITDIPLASLARAVKPDGSRLFVQHVTFAPGQSTGWHNHPGPMFVMIIDGSLTVEDALGSNCPTETYAAGQGFVDRGFGNVHRATAGAAGAEFWATYVLPTDAHVVREPVTGSFPTPPQCA
jgi:hypothetical protein